MTVLFAMQILRLGVSLILALLAGLSPVRAEPNPPLQQPQLRIETGMHTAVLHRTAISADGKLLVTGASDKTVRLWSLPDFNLIRTFRVPIGPSNDGRIYAAAISPDGRLIAVGGWDAYGARNPNGPKDQNANLVYLFDTVSGTLVRRLGPLPNVINELVFSADGKYLAAGLGRDNGIRLWSIPFPRNARADMDYQNGVFNMAFGPLGTGLLATTADDGMIRLYENVDWSLTPRMIKAPGGASPFGVSFSPDGKTLAIAYEDKARIELYSVPDLTLVHQVDTAFAVNGALAEVTFSKDGQSLYAGGTFLDKDNSRAIIRWSDGGRGPARLLRGPGNTVLKVVALPGGGIVYAGAEPTLGMYDVNDKFVVGKESPKADMRSKLTGRFANSADGTGVWFGLKSGAQDPWIFDVGTLSFTAGSKPSGYLEPVINTLKIDDWTDKYFPKLNDKPIVLEQFETSRSLAIAGDATKFVLGTDYGIRRYEAAGKEIPPYLVYTEGVAWGVNLSADGSVIVAAIGDGTIRWFRASDGAELLTFFVHAPDKRWIAWTPSGYYAASPGGEDLIGWHVNGKDWDAPVNFFPAALFRNRFYRPDIVQLVLRTKDETRAVAQANHTAKRKSEDEGLDKILPPVVELLTDPRGNEAKSADFQLTYRLHSPSGKPVTRLELRVDGQLIQPRAVEVLEDNLELDTNLTMTAPLPPRDSIVSLTAFIDEQPSETVQIPVRWTGRSQKGPKPKLYALLVGVSAYDEPKLKLNYAAKDAIDVAAALARQKGRFFEDVETVLLLDKDADEDRIEIELARLRKKVGPNDYAIVFMAGHGVTDAQGAFHFLPANASLAEDELAARSLNGLIIRDNLRTMQGKVLLFVDACNAGNGIGGEQALADMAGFANEFVQSNGVVMYASSTGRQFSYENSQWGNGAFTSALIATLDDPQAFGRDARLSIFELAEELGSRVDQLTGGMQTPVMTKSAAIPNFYLAAIQ